MKLWKLFDIKTKSDLKEYFVLTSVLGIGMFLTISLFSLSFYYQIQSHQKNLDLRAHRIQEHFQQTLYQHNLAIKYIERKLKYGIKAGRMPLIPVMDDFLKDSYVEAIDVVGVDWMRDRKDPQLTLLIADSRVPEERGLIFENFLKRIDEYKIPLYNSGKRHSFIFNPGIGKKWYLGQINYIEGRKTELIIAWIPIEKMFLAPLRQDQPLSITLSNFLYPTMPAVRADFLDGRYQLSRVAEVSDLGRRTFSQAEHRLFDEGSVPGNVTISYVYASGEQYGWSWIVLVAGLSISVLVSLLFFNLINRNIEVHRLVEEKTQDVIRASQEAMKANEVKTRFLANISHEIRTPLNIILGMAELLNETRLSTDQKKYVDTFKKSGFHLLDLINDVIDMIRLEGDEAHFENKDFSISEVVQEVSSFCAVNAQSKSVDFSYFIDPAVPALVSGDQRRLKQILLNLINNSIKFTDAGFVKLTATTSGVRGQKCDLRLVIEDSGIGISESDQKRIFNAFTQIDPSSTRNKGGVGLGLSIVKTILNKLGGAIQIESKVELGSRFVVTVPYEVLEEKSWITEITEPFADSLRGKNISVLAEDGFELKMLDTLFRAMDCPVNTFTSEYRMVKTFKKTPSFNEIFIIDHDAIQKNIPEFLEEVKKILHPKITTVFLLPIMHDKSEIEALQRLPHCKIAYKPLALNNLFAALANHTLPPGEGFSKDTAEILDQDCKILIVEDDIENRQLLQAYLNGIKCQATFASSGNEALQIYKRLHPQIIVTDIQMPEMDGFKLTSLIREYEKECSVKASVIFALSADALPEHKATAREVGVDKYLTKPISKAVFIQSLVEAERLYRPKLALAPALTKLSQKAH